MKRFPGLWFLPAFAGALLCAGCTSPQVPRAVLYRGDAADPAAPEARYVPPPNSLAEGRADQASSAVPATAFTCSMHPEAKAAGLGACPTCRMPLMRRAGR